MVWMSVDVQWIVIGFPVWFVFCVVQVESNIKKIYNVQIYLGGDFQIKLLENFV